MTNSTPIPAQHPKPQTQTFRNAVLSSFSQPSADSVVKLSSFNEKQWQTNLRWLDTSGLALYLLGHLRQHGHLYLLPAQVAVRLQQNLADNTARNAELFAEAIEISRLFTSAKLLFAHTKGFTLSPDSVPEPALRCQLDLDLLIHEEHAEDAQRILEARGYRLDVKVSKTWEFRADVSEAATINNLYKIKPQRSIDLHLVSPTTLRQRITTRSFAGIMLPVLTPADQYVTQAKHLLKHLCCAFTRAAWLLEFRRHTLAHQDDATFWNQVVQQVKEAPDATLALAFASLLSSEIFGDAIPVALKRYISATITPPIHLWIKLYGAKALTADFPGTKIYLLLKAEVHPKILKPTQRRHSDLVPFRLPRMIAHGYKGENLFSSLHRYRTQFFYLLFRLRYHCVEGLRYGLENFRFQRHLRGLVL
jgi:hypothetical protein